MLKDYDKTISYGEPLLKNDKIKDRQTIAQYVGQAYYEKGNFKKALPYIEEYVEKTPKVTEDVFYQLAYTQYRCDRCEDAIANFEQINGLNSKLGHPRSDLCHLHVLPLRQIGHDSQLGGSGDCGRESLGSVGDSPVPSLSEPVS
jgi:tetratricopeptide (TPR) repeat protein